METFADFVAANLGEIVIQGHETSFSESHAVLLAVCERKNETGGTGK